MVADTGDDRLGGFGQAPRAARPARYWPTSIVFFATRAASRSSVSLRASNVSISVAVGSEQTIV